MIKNLRINNFRNYFCQNISIPEDYNTIILFGENGSGKTNILEAISLFSQTRGLRSSKYEEMINKSSNDNFWNITVQLEDFVYSSGYAKSGKAWKRVFKVFEKPTRDLSEFSKYNCILWLTYETDRLFLQSPSYRRDFIDMLCSVTIKNHMNSVHNYEKLTKERLKILKTYFGLNLNKDIEKWLDIIEEKISNTGLIIAQSRIKISAKLEESQMTFSEFPAFKNKMTGALESCIIDAENSDLLNSYKSELLSRRHKDYLSGSTTFGPNRSDWRVFHVEKQMESYLCSAGEQKILLSGVFLSFVMNMLQTNNRKLILLLDDVVAHLDTTHRKSLFKYLKDIISRNKKAICVWLSGTDKSLFEEFRNEALFLKIQNNSIERD